jgi:hypothetical protein
MSCGGVGRHSGRFGPRHVQSVDPPRPLQLNPDLTFRIRLTRAIDRPARFRNAHRYIHLNMPKNCGGRPYTAIVRGARWRRPERPRRWCSRCKPLCGAAEPLGAGPVDAGRRFPVSGGTDPALRLPSDTSGKAGLRCEAAGQATDCRGAPQGLSWSKISAISLGEPCHAYPRR